MRCRLSRVRSQCVFKKKTVLLPISRFCFSDWGQLCDFGLLLVLGENRPVGVNVIHREKEGDSFYFSPKKKKKGQRKHRIIRLWSRNMASNTLLTVKCKPNLICYLFLWTYSCRECLLETFPTSPLDESLKRLLPCWISSCSLPHPESVGWARSVPASLTVTPDRLEFMEYLRTVMTVFSVE